ncbi:hypothetical protein DHX103_07110 [Planococcus sp. X10-3]|uniref:hypothetical protein n=1 Tax=Planococcus sp. X10-3 TaxID=3061240 RepID=UPI003BB1812F
MKLLGTIIACTILGYLLLFFGPFFGGLLAFGIILGILVRGLILVSEMHKLMAAKEPKKSVLDEYLEERNRKENGTQLKE